MPASPYVRISSADDISYAVPSTSSAGTHEAIQTIVTGRKCWKTIKGKGEVVWPPYLEAALVEGLEKYRPVETRSARALGRFPLRNKFISDYIYNTTGKRRTPKQVGSRLQQLRDTCEGKRILKLLSRRPGDPPSDEEAAQSSEPSSSTSPVREYVNIDVLPDHIPWAPTSPSNSSSSLLSGPRPIRAIDNMVTFKCVAALPSSSYSLCRVYKDGSVLYEEQTTLDLSSSSCMPSQYGADVDCTFLYSTRLVPQFWGSLCDYPDIGAYSILQQIIRGSSSDSTSTSGSPPSPVEDIAFEVLYRFNTSHSVPQSPVSSNGDGASYSVESSPELGGEYDEYAMLPAAHDMRGPSVISRSFPQSNQRHYQSPHHTGGFELPPGLIQPGDEGYTSHPQSPLDLAFGASAAAGIAPGADPVESMCASYAGCNIDYPGAAPSIYDADAPSVGLVGPAYGVNVMHYSTGF